MSGALQWCEPSYQSFKDNGGYAIMSNDTRLGPLLAKNE
jgi:hypothetical protein